MLNTQTFLFKGRGARPGFSHRAESVKSLVTFVLSVCERPYQIPSQALKMSHVLYNEFQCSCALIIIVYKGMSYYHQETFFQIVLYLKMHKINCLVSDSLSVNQHQLLSPAELYFLLVSFVLLVCSLWWLQTHSHSDSTQMFLLWISKFFLFYGIENVQLLNSHIIYNIISCVEVSFLG